MIDMLTGNRGRRAFEKCIESLIFRKKPFTLLLLSIDNFSIINEFYGHYCGDNVLMTVGQSLDELEDIEVFRLSGSQFVIVIKTDSRQNIQGHINAIRHCIKLNGRLNHLKTDLTVSIGIVLSNEGLTNEEYYNRLNITLRYARADGKEGTRFFDDRFEEELRNEVELEEQFNIAIAQNEFELHLQSLYQLNSNKIRGFEVLLRWPNRVRMDLNIGQIIEKAEKSGQIMALDQWVVRNTFKMIKAHPDIFNHKTVCINVSAQSFLSFEFLKFFLREEEAHKINPKQIELEITEYSMMHDLDRTIRMMMIYKSRGISFALDDFGTQYSSLNYLKELPFDVLKIDKSYIDSICQDTKSTAIVRIILELCKELNLQTIAEGIETEEQKKLLESMGCEIGQGYYLDKPMPIAAYLQYVG